MVDSPGRLFPVEISYLPLPNQRPLHVAVADGVASVWSQTEGDVLAFLPGVAEAQTIQRERITNALPRLEAMIGRTIAAKEVPGLSIAIIHDDEVVYRKGFGLREIGKPDMVGADTVFQIASLSKPVSSTVVAALVGEGIISWDSRLADIDPAFRLAEAYPTSMITIRDLFAHRSGLPGGAGDDLEEIGYGRDEILQRLRLLPRPPAFAQRTPIATSASRPERSGSISGPSGTARGSCPIT